MKVTISYQIEPAEMNKDCGGFVILDETMAEFQPEAIAGITKLVEEIHHKMLKKQKEMLEMLREKYR